jgi:SpoIID/LytB domain protein
MRPLPLLIATLAVLAVATVASAASTATSPSSWPVFVLDGGGWGHGVGMSQWGAYGQALQGRTHTQILTTYYPGTTLEQTTPRTVRVLVVAAAKSVRLASTGGLRIRDAVGKTHEVAPGELTIGPKLELEVDGVRTGIPGPLTISSSDATPVTLQDTGYRGRITLSSDGKTLQAINAVALELYLQGVVPGEMPRSWPLEALEAQAVAARTYALVSIIKGKPFDLYSDWRSQVYYGVEEESPATTKAIRETRGQVLTYDGLPAQTLYFSSSGGRTRSAVDVYGKDVPYLVAVDDPWDDVAGNPNHRWQPAAITGAKLAAKLKVTSRVVDVTTSLGSDDRPNSVAFTTTTGVVRAVTARDLRQLLGLRSTSFRLGVLRLDPTQQGTSVGSFQLRGVARDVDEPRLERLGPSGSWTQVRRLTVRADGSFRIVVRPTATTTYRLTGTGVVGPSLTVTVAEGTA